MYNSTGLILLPFLLISAMTWALALYTLRRYDFPAAKPFSILMLMIGVWAFFYTIELLSPDVPSAILWVKIEYISILTLPGLSLIHI